MNFSFRYLSKKNVNNFPYSFLRTSYSGCRSLNFLKCLYSVYLTSKGNSCPNNFVYVEANVSYHVRNFIKIWTKVAIIRNSFQDCMLSKLKVIRWFFESMNGTKLCIVSQTYYKPNHLNTVIYGWIFFIYFLFLSKSTKISYNSLLESIDNNGFCVACLFICLSVLCVVLILGH